MISLRKWRESHILAADAITASLAVGVFVAIVYWFFNANEIAQILDGARTAMYSSAASICGSLLGFIITAVSIVSVFGSLPRFNLLAKSNRFREILAIYFHAIYWLAVSTAVALIGMVFDRDGSPQLLLTGIALFMFSVTAARVWRCIWILQKMTELSLAPIRDTQPPS